MSSKDRYLFGSFEIQMKVAAGDTAGTVTAFYVSSSKHSSPLSIELICLGKFCVHFNDGHMCV